MFKRIISLGLCLVMLAVLFAGCGEKATTTTTSTDDLPSTINLIGITDKSTTQEAIDLVEEALNKISKTRYKTRIELTLVTADEYIAEVESRIEAADHAAIKLKAINKFNALAQKEANNAQKLLSEASGKKHNKWTSQVTTVIASTMTTGEIYSAEQTTVYEDGKIETVYPDAQSPIDILMIDGKEMYDYLNEKGYLLSVEKKLDEKFTKFRQYIYPTFFSQLKAMTGDINAIPNNNLLAEYTYLVVDKTIAEAYDNGNGFNIDNVENYADLEAFLSYVKANHKNVAPLATQPEALGIYKYMDGDVAIGTYYDPIYGFSAAEGTDFVVQNLLAIPEYQAHVELMKKYQDAGYIVEGAKDYAVNIVVGDASIEEEYGDDYEVKVLQNPFVEPEAIYDGMFAVSSYTSSEDRALEIIEMFTTDSEAKNLLQYGIQDNGDNTAYANYKLVEVEDGKFTVELLNNNYTMDTGLTGNVYMGYPAPGETFDAWTYYKRTNLDSGISPFLHLYVEESELDNILTSVLKRAALTEALKPLDIDYAEYVREVGNKTNKGTDFIDKMRNQYAVDFIAALADSSAQPTPLNFVTKSNASAAVQEFVKFALSKEGQEIIKNSAYAPIAAGAASYAKVANLSGTITIYANTGATKTYIEKVFNGLADAFTAMYPNVTITLPVANGSNGYDASMTKVAGANDLGITYSAVVDGAKLDQVADNYLSLFLDKNHGEFSQSWYENILIEKVKREKYADIISANDLEVMVKNHVASLGGAKNQYDSKNKVYIQNTERLTLAAAKDTAGAYYTNIKYLRVMADEILFKDLSEEERAAYDSMTDIDFENAVFDYVRKNYENENNLTEDDYKKRVEEFMVSVLEYTSAEDNTVKYLVSWEDFVAAEEGSVDYMVAANQIKDAYWSKLTGKYSQGLLNLMTLSDLMDAIYDIMLEDYLVENGLDQKEFEASVKDKYLKAVGTNAADFDVYAKNKTSDEYKNYVKKLRKKYKAILIENFSANAYKNGEKGISNEKVVETINSHFLEEELGIYQKMADMSGLSLADFKSSEAHYKNYEKYVKDLKTKYVYTLRTKYSQSQIDKWDLATAKTNIFNMLYETGFYTNELARYIGLELSEYMLAKSDATAYQNYLNKIAEKLSAEFAEYNYDAAALLKGDGTEFEAAAEKIVAEKFYGDKVSVTDELKRISGDYVKDYTNVNEMKANADVLTDDGFFMAVVNELQAMWDEAKEAAN